MRAHCQRIAVAGWFLGLACCSCELPESKVAGRALDAETLEPLANVRIEWNGQSRTTGATGEYSFSLPVGIHELRVSHGDARYSTLLVVGHTKWMEGLAQAQDLLVREKETTTRAFTLNFLGADFNGVAQNPASGLLGTNLDGAHGAFLPVTGELLQLPQWDAHASILYSADIEAKGRLYRHDVAKQTTTAVECAGFQPSGVTLFCLSPDGNTALVGTNEQNLVLRNLKGECTSEPIGKPFSPVTPARCAFDEAGQAYVVTRRSDKESARRDAGELKVLDTRAAAPAPQAVAWLSDWDVNYPSILPDGQLLLERSGSAGEPDAPETLLVNLQTQSFSTISKTEAPVTLMGDRLYYIARERALRVRLLSSGKEATLVNGAVFATPR